MPVVILEQCSKITIGKTTFTKDIDLTLNGFTKFMFEKQSIYLKGNSLEYIDAIEIPNHICYGKFDNYGGNWFYWCGNDKCNMIPPIITPSAVPKYIPFKEKECYKVKDKLIGKFKKTAPIALIKNYDSERLYFTI